MCLVDTSPYVHKSVTIYLNNLVCIIELFNLLNLLTRFNKIYITLSLISFLSVYLIETYSTLYHQCEKICFAHPLPPLFVYWNRCSDVQCSSLHYTVTLSICGVKSCKLEINLEEVREASPHMNISHVSTVKWTFPNVHC